MNGDELRGHGTRRVDLDTAADHDVNPVIAALILAGPGELPEVLQALLGRPAWHRDAACAGMGTDVFFPDRGSTPAAGLAVCRTCSVAAQCAEAGKDELGVWGGTTERGRRLVRSSGRLPRPAA